ncbi:MAGUK p55 subfamily member 7-like isoform 2-T3 [Spinachia spinachia]
MLSRTEHRGVCRLISSVMSGTESYTDREEDYRFLHSMLMEKKLHLLFKIHERLKRFEKRSPVPVQDHAASLASDLAEELMCQCGRHNVTELVALISKPNLKGATIRRDRATGAIVVARIMRGGAADRSGLIHEGDELKEVNGVSLEHMKPQEILPLLTRSQAEVTFKIVPASTTEAMSSNKKLFMRALFDYDPNDDPAVPCKDAAVAFQRGDVLRVVSMEDDTWWQACRLGDGGARAGLIPSQQLRERRVALRRPKALVTPRRVSQPPAIEDVDYRAITGINIAGLRRSFRLGRMSGRAAEAARSKRWSTGLQGSIRPPTYKEVIPYHRDPKDRHRLVVLVGPGGVGVNELKRRLLISDPDLFGVTVPYTTRERSRRETEGVDYHFVSVPMFEEDILNHRFVEYGRHKGHYYGTSLDSVHRVMAEGKVCLLDVHPNKIKHVYTSEFKPYVVFVKPPSIEELRVTRRRAKSIRDEEDKNPARIFSEEDFEDMINSAETIESQCGHLFDKEIVNGDIAVAFRELKMDLEKLKAAKVQWIPAKWICSLPTKARRSVAHGDGFI